MSGYLVFAEIVESTTVLEMTVVVGVIGVLLCCVAGLTLVRQGRRVRATTAQIGELETQCKKERTRNSLLSTECHVLQRLATADSLDKGLAFLLRLCVPNAKRGWAAVVTIDGTRATVRQSRGLSRVSAERLHFDDQAIRLFRKQHNALLTTHELLQSEGFGWLTADDMAKSAQLCLVWHHDADHGRDLVLLATELCPRNAPVEDQFALGSRLLESISGLVERTSTIALEKHELQSTQEILELRSILDRLFDSPIQMLEAFLMTLCEIIGADRAVLFVTMQADGTRHRALVRCGKRLQTGIAECWQRHEETLFGNTAQRDMAATWHGPELQCIGVDTLIGSAIQAPLTRQGRLVGAICLTRSTHQPFPQSRTNLVHWAAQYLSETIPRILNQLVNERQAKTDGLTKLANRRTFDQQIVAEIRHAMLSRESCSLLLLDLDHFKNLNDTYGHQAGDEVLRVAAAVLRDQISRTRETDRALTARYGGEEMVVLLPGFGPAGTARVAESIRATLAKTRIDFEGSALHVTASIGTATCPDHASTADHLVAAADNALYRAKESGRNRVCQAEPVCV